MSTNNNQVIRIGGGSGTQSRVITNVSRPAQNSKIRKLILQTPSLGLLTTYTHNHVYHPSPQPPHNPHTLNYGQHRHLDHPVYGICNSATSQQPIYSSVHYDEIQARPTLVYQQLEYAAGSGMVSMGILCAANYNCTVFPTSPRTAIYTAATTNDSAAAATVDHAATN
jgi:hypothetical protein